MSHYNFKLERTNRPLHQENLGIEHSIEQFIELYNIKPALENVNIIQAWHNATGDLVKQKTGYLFVKNKKLFVRLTSAALKAEMLMKKTQLLAEINQSLENTSIDDIIFF